MITRAGARSLRNSAIAGAQSGFALYVVACRRRAGPWLPLLPLLGKPATRPLMHTEIGKRGPPRLWFTGGFVEAAAVLNGLQQQTSVALSFDPSAERLAAMATIDRVATTHGSLAWTFERRS